MNIIRRSEFKALSNLAQRLLRAEFLRNFCMLVNVKVCFPFLKDPAKSKRGEKGGRYKVFIVPAEFPSCFFSFYHLKGVLFYFKTIIQ